MEGTANNIPKITAGMDRAHALDVFVDTFGQEWIGRNKRMRELLSPQLTGEQATALQRVLARESGSEDMMADLERLQPSWTPEPDCCELVKFKSLQARYVGAKVLYTELPYSCVATVNDIDADNRRARFNLCVIPSRGFLEPPTMKFTLGSVWFLLSFDQEFCYGIYSEWTLYFRDDFVSEVQKRVGALPDNLRDDDRVQHIQECIHTLRRPRRQSEEDRKSFLKRLFRIGY